MKKNTSAMKNYAIVAILTLSTLFSNVLNAQWGPGGPGGGGGNGDIRRSQNQQQGPPGMNNGMGQQTKGIGKILGVVLDSTNAKAVEYANVALYNKATNKLVDGTIADEKGKFSIENLPDGDYKIVISFLGYANKTVDNIKMVKEKAVNIGVIRVSEGAQTLAEVTVSGQKAVIEEKVDRLIYNADKDQLAKGGDGADVLRKVPLLQVDLEGNVSIRGNSNIKVLINNKPSTIMASSIADALKQIPADMIKTVEVITSPSSKYDAEGASGIINIITKKDKLQGYNLGLDIGAGLRGSNLGLNGSFRSGKFGMTMGGWGRAFYNKAESNMLQTTKSLTNATKTVQNATASDFGAHGNYNLGMDYDIDKTQSITGSVRYGIRGFNRDQRQFSSLFTDNILKFKTIKDINSTDASNNVDVNLDYVHTFKPQQEWTFATQYSRNDLANNFDSDNLNESFAILNRLRNKNDNLNQEVTLQTDYQTPLSDNALIEFGGKGIFRKVNSDYSYLSAKDAIADYTQDFTRPAGTLNYGQNIASAYTSLTLSTGKKITIKAGGRFENTSINATQDNKAIPLKNYSNLVPSLNISKPFGASTVKLGYNRRIQRPGLQQLNPNFNAANSQDVRVGNPNLRPELTDNIELGLSTMVKKTYLNFSVFGRYTDNSINQVRRPLDTTGAILTTYENIGSQKSLGSNIFTNIYLTNTWSINGGLDAYYTILEGQTTGLDGKSITAKNSGINFGGRLMSQVTLKNGWGLQAFSFIRGRQVQLQGTQGGHGMYSLGFRKDFKNKKGSIGFSAENFAQRGWNMRSELNSLQFTQVNDNLLLNRNFKVNLNYKFGKMTFVDSRKKTRGVKNDDVMGGGGDGGGGGGDTQPQGGGGARPQGGAPQQGQGRPQQGGMPPAQGGAPMKSDTSSMKQKGQWQGRPSQDGTPPPAGQPKKNGGSEGDKKQQWQGRPKEGGN